jgi:NADPH:quinone reductase-like Zn-dependent oxidoreductase
VARAKKLFDLIGARRLAVCIDHTSSLADAAEAHCYMQNCGPRGKVLLIP